MAFDFAECRAVLYRGLIDSLKTGADAIRLVAADEPAGINGLSFDILPWHRFVCLSFRASSDTHARASTGVEIDIRYSPADWKYYELIENGGFDEVRDYLGNAYPESGGPAGQEAFHLMLLAAADALLDEQVGKLLEDFGLNGTVHGNRLPWRGLEYIVIDEDKSVQANYCEIVLANRLTRRLLGKEV